MGKSWLSHLPPSIVTSGILGYIRERHQQQTKTGRDGIVFVVNP